MKSPNFLSTLPVANRLARAGVILGVTAVSIVAVPQVESATAAQEPGGRERQASPPEGEQHIGTAVQGFRDPKTSNTGALYSARRVR